MMRKSIFWKVYLIWFVRRIVPLMFLEVVFLLIALKVFASKVFVGKVLENAAISSGANYAEFFRYILDSFFQTNVFIQIIILILLGVGALMLRDFGRIAKTYFKTVWQKGETKKEQP